ncbi:hypothetical protein [Deinococcus yunweiensis]|uniref:hypothetical protein n=1 Tax=Deinococcus yunweiensis TaxID=367282 RepID=UPI00398F2330
MRALRLGVTITCGRHHLPDGPRYVLHGLMACGTVTTGEHRVLGSDLVTDLMAQLEPHLHRQLSMNI